MSQSVASMLIKLCEGDCQIQRKVVSQDDEKIVPLLHQHPPPVQVMEKESSYHPPALHTLVDVSDTNPPNLKLAIRELQEIVDTDNALVDYKDEQPENKE